MLREKAHCPSCKLELFAGYSNAANEHLLSNHVHNEKKQEKKDAPDALWSFNKGGQGVSGVGGLELSGVNIVKVKEKKNVIPKKIIPKRTSSVQNSVSLNPSFEVQSNGLGPNRVAVNKERDVSRESKQQRHNRIISNARNILSSDARNEVDTSDLQINNRRVIRNTSNSSINTVPKSNRRIEQNSRAHQVYDRNIEKIEELDTRDNKINTQINSNISDINQLMQEINAKL